MAATVARIYRSECAMPRELDAILELLTAREPLFHHRELVHSAETFDLEVADDFWEVGASGRSTTEMS